MDKSEDTFIDYYQILQCDRSASLEELKKSYQRLILSLHPDKVGKSEESDEFCLVQKAWTVLKDSESRKQYDAELSCIEHNDLLLYESIVLSEMNFDDSEGVFTYSCRCGGTYLLESNEAKNSKVIISCDECSFSIQVNM